MFKAKKTKQLFVAIALATGLSVQANAETIIIGDFETGDLGSFWQAGSFAAYDHSWGGVADRRIEDVKLLLNKQHEN